MTVAAENSFVFSLCSKDDLDVDIDMCVGDGHASFSAIYIGDGENWQPVLFWSFLFSQSVFTAPSLLGTLILPLP